MSVLLDSVILIDHLNGISAATRYLDSLRSPAISVITRAEVLSGAVIRSEIVVEWLESFPALPIGIAEADLAGQLRRQFKWRLPDAFQAALAQIHGLKLATRNTRDFDPARHTFVVVPYSLK